MDNPVKTERPEDALLRMLRLALWAAYTVMVLLATLVIILGKMLFDFLYEAMRISGRHKDRKRVECRVSETRSR